MTGGACGEGLDRISSIPSEWTHFVGVVIAPKSRLPCAVYVHEDGGFGINEAYMLMSPDRSRIYAGGYFEEAQFGCARQHALPGLCSTADAGAGLGTALYLAGAMVVAAGLDNHRGDFPYDMEMWIESDQACTHSPVDSAQRTGGASGVWRGLVDREVARRVGAERGRRRFEIDLLEWTSVLQTGLVLYLGPDFAPGRYPEREVVPPAAMGMMDWRYTPDAEARRYIDQNAKLTPDPQAYRDAVSDALQDNGQGRLAAKIPGYPRSRAVANPSARKDSRNAFAARDKEWVDLYTRGDWA